MSEPRPLSEEKRIHGCLGLAMMASRLAYQRNGHDHTYAEPDLFVERAKLRKNDGFVLSREYYAIIDRIAQGEKP